MHLESLWYTKTFTQQVPTCVTPVTCQQVVISSASGFLVLFYFYMLKKKSVKEEILPPAF